MEYSICNKGEGFMSVVLEKPFARGEEFTAEIATEQRKLQAGGLSTERAYVKAVDAVAAARAAGVPTVVTTNDYTAHHDFTGALRVLPSLRGVDAGQLRGLGVAHVFRQRSK